jgi:tetratricopeptide (TPR) repeat protein
MTPTPPQRLMVAGDSLGFYLQKLVWPLSLYVDYGRTPESVIATGGSIAGWTALAVATVGAGLTLKRRPWIAGGFGVFVGGICLVLGLVPFDFQIYSTVADRYLYLSMLGPAILIAFALRSAPRPVFVVAGALVLGLAAMTVRQSRFWSSSETLMAHQNANNPDSLASHAILAGLANRDNNPAEAEKHYRAFLAIRPSDVTVNGQLADLLRESGRYAESLQYYKAAFDNGQHTALLFNNWGLSLWKLNRHREAADAFARALAENPDNFNANLNLGLMQANLGQLDQAAQHLQRATELDPSSAIARDSLAKVQALRARLQNR